jgi:hypothetical protein
MNTISLEQMTILVVALVLIFGPVLLVKVLIQRLLLAYRARHTNAPARPAGAGEPGRTGGGDG